MRMNLSDVLRKTVNEINSKNQMKFVEELVSDTNVTVTNDLIIYEPKTIAPASGKWFDPRQEDMPSDSHLWSHLMEYVQKEQSLFDTLNTIRGVGATITFEKNTYVIKPRIDPTGDTGWETEDMYNQIKKQELMPHIVLIKEALTDLKRCGVQ